MKRPAKVSPYAHPAAVTAGEACLAPHTFLAWGLCVLKSSSATVHAFVLVSASEITLRNQRYDGARPVPAYLSCRCRCFRRAWGLARGRARPRRLGPAGGSCHRCAGEHKLLYNSEPRNFKLQKIFRAAARAWLNRVHRNMKAAGEHRSMQRDRYAQPTGLPIVCLHSRARLGTRAAASSNRSSTRKYLLGGASTIACPRVTHRSCVALACGLGCNPRHVVGHVTRSDTEARTETWLNEVIRRGGHVLRLHLFSSSCYPARCVYQVSKCASMRRCSAHPQRQRRPRSRIARCHCRK